MCAAPTQRKAGGVTVKRALVGASAAGIAALVALWLYQQRAQLQTSPWYHRIRELNLQSFILRANTLFVTPPDYSAARAPKDSDHSGTIGAAVGAGLVLAVQAAYRLFRKWRRGSVIEPEKTLVRDLQTLLRSGYLADVTLLVGDTHVKAHRAVLVFRCPGLSGMLQDECLEAGSVRIRVTDVEPDVLNHLLLFAYTDEVEVDPPMAQKLLAAAEKYGMSTLREYCERVISQNLCVENAAACAVLAVKHSCEHLTESAVRFIAAHTKDVMATRGCYLAVRNNPYEAVVVTRLVAAAPTKTRWL